MRTNQKNNRKTLSSLPLLVIIIFIPFLLGEYEFKNKLSMYQWYPDVLGFDLFLYWKAIAVIAVAAIMILLIFFNKENILFLDNKKFIPLLIYEVFVLLSSIFSEYSTFAYSGLSEHFESLWVILGYGIITFYSYLVIIRRKNITVIVKVLIFQVLLICIIGIMQLTGHDFFRLFFSSKGYDFKFELNRVYGTFSNPNYVGSYVALILPSFLIFACSKRNLKVRMVSILITIGLILCLVGSKSSTGFFVTFFLILLMGVMNIQKVKKYWKPILCVLGVLVLIIIFFIDFINKNFITKVIAALNSNVNTENNLDMIETNNDNIQIKYKGNDLNIKFSIVNQLSGEYEFEITDNNGKWLENRVSSKEGSVYITDKRFNGITIMPISIENLYGILAFAVNIDGLDWYFTNQTDGTYYYINQAAKLDKIIATPSAVFTDFPSFASGRGYIWAKTIPILNECILLGKGADSFAAVFPNDDYVNNYNNGFLYNFVTKPHNLYLQIAVQSGIISLLAFMLFYFLYFCSCIKIYRKRIFDSLEIQFGFGIFIGSIGYMLTGVFNDSTITVAPIFWCLLGIGIGINYQIQNNENK